MNDIVPGSTGRVYDFTRFCKFCGREGDTYLPGMYFDDLQTGYREWICERCKAPFICGVEIGRNLRWKE